MEKRGYPKYLTVFIGFKYFSQFQHYSKQSITMIEEASEPHLFFHLLLAINSITILTDMQIQIVDGKESKFLERLRKLEDGFDKVFED